MSDQSLSKSVEAWTDVPVRHAGLTQADRPEVAGAGPVLPNLGMATRRLVVLIPDVDLDESTLARWIWMLAAPAGRAVVYLGRSSDLAVHLRLITLAALTRDDSVRVETCLTAHENWGNAVHEVTRPGDAVICLAEHRVRVWGRWRSVADLLTSPNGPSVQVLTGLCLAEQGNPSLDRHRLVRRAGLALILVVALWLQLVIVPLQQGWTQTLLLSLIVLVEFSLIGIWNAFTIR